MIVTICVFSLFHPTEFEVQPARGSVVMVGEQAVEKSITLHGPSTVTGRNGADTAFILSIPGKIRREFHGRLEIRTDAGHLQAIVSMDREVAVASIVAAELAASVPLEARKAQAVAARSFIVASKNRHQGYDFCDTTHCQFLRGVPLHDEAAKQTHDLVVAYQGHVLVTPYSANCGGHTRDFPPYFAVECPVKGKVFGHQLGMCQQGAAELARKGESFREIILHYFPATTLIEDTDDHAVSSKPDKSAPPAPHEPVHEASSLPTTPATSPRAAATPQVIRLTRR
jgi:peptidoglycan hydrolase-like amidase